LTPDEYFDRQTAALVIIKARALSQLLLENAYLLLEIVNNDLLVAVHPGPTPDTQERGYTMLFFVRACKKWTELRLHSRSLAQRSL